jgi:hypothetical protein
MPSRFGSGAKLLCAIQLLAAGLLIAACGGSSPTRSATVAAAQKALVAKSAHDPVSSGVVTHKPFPGTGGGEINDDNPGHAVAPGSGKTALRQASGQRDPCTLVSRAEAQSILGRPLATPVEAPLGPTCIYRPVGAKNLITLTVGSVDFARIRAQTRNRRRLDVGGRTAYCGDYGQPTTFVALASGGTLTITAPCAIGIRFATKAVPRLKS